MHDTCSILQQEFYVEIRAAVKRTGRVNLVPYNDKYRYVGFTSVYGFPKEAANKILKSNNTKRLDIFPVYSDVLYVDFDNAEEAAERFEDRIQQYNYEKYNSGGRSVHFHIPIKPMYGKNVPASQKKWVADMSDFGEGPTADLTIYRHASLYRLPGTYHSKNPGRKKELVYKQQAAYIEPLTIENLPKVEFGMSNPGYVAEDPKFFYSMLGKLINKEVDSGGRHKHAYKIVMAARSSGLDIDRAKELLYKWNNQMCHPPKGEWELDKLIKWVYYD